VPREPQIVRRKLNRRSSSVQPKDVPGDLDCLPSLGDSAAVLEPCLQKRVVSSGRATPAREQRSLPEALVERLSDILAAALVKDLRQHRALTAPAMAPHALTKNR
jgi:hypothetical protein